MERVNRIGMDTSEHVFQLHGVNASDDLVLRRKMRRKQMVAFFEKLAPTVIAIEACGASHHRARLLRSFGHEVKLIAPQLVKPYVKRGKNDAADAEALCKAMSRPTGAVRAGEDGRAAGGADAHRLVEPLLERVQAEGHRRLQAPTGRVDAKLAAWQKSDECSRRLVKIPGVGPIGAALLEMKAPAPERFKSGRQYAAWIGLTPKDHATAGKARLGAIAVARRSLGEMSAKLTKAGDEALRSVVGVGATAAIQQAQRRGRVSPWLAALLKRKPPRLLLWRSVCDAAIGGAGRGAVALANKVARIAWKLMVTGQSYAATSAPAALAV